MVYFKSIVVVLFSVQCVLASSLQSRRYNLVNRLSAHRIDANKIGCKCIMSASTPQNTDSTMCMCFNRKDGTINDTTKCRQYTDTIFTFCTDVTDETDTWQECIKHYCPCDGDQDSPIPRNKVNF